MKKLLIKSLIPVLSVFFLASCDKEDTPQPVGDAGATIIQVVGGGDAPAYGHGNIGVDFISTPQTFDAFDLRRNAPSKAALAVPVTVVVKDDPAAIAGYNAENGTSLVPLPTAWYSTNYPLVGGNYTITFAAGETGKNIRITIPNSTLLDPSSAYAVAFTLVSNSEGFLNSAGKTFVFEIGAKNAYDGIYSVVSGNVQRYSAPGVPTTGDALNGSLAGNPDIEVVTTGANSDYMDAFGWHDAANNGLVGGIDPVFITVDPATNLVTVNSTTNLTLGNWAGHTNRYDPATKTLYLAFRWNPATTTREYETVLKYIGPR